MHIENISKEDIVKLEIQTGVPRTYQYKDNIFTKLE
jgi:bisphosphoglycerate-dependent phosphoglycerate mutase